MKYFLLLGIVLSVSVNVAHAQQVDNDILKRAIAPLQNQRNNALDQAVTLQAQLDKAVEELNAAKAKIKELEEKTDKK